MSCDPLSIVYGGILIADNMSHYYADTVNALVVYVPGGPVTIQASNDNFITSIFDQVYNANELIEINVTALNWRIVGDGSFYIGDIVKVKRPTYPYSFNKQVSSNDVVTLGGTPHSKIYNIKRVGFFNWDKVEEADLADWELWYEQSGYYRDPFVIQEPITLDLITCTSEDSFPMQLDVVDLYSGSLRFNEYL